MFFGKKFRGHQGGELSGLDVLVLSIIKNNEGISGYDITQKINKKFKDLWKASPGTIYPLLNRLEKLNYIHVEDITDNNRQKRIYTITETGKNAIKTVLEKNLEPSISTLGDYIKTVMRGFPFDKAMHGCMSCGPFRFMDVPTEESVETDDFSLENIQRIENIIARLRHSKDHLQTDLEKLSKRIEQYEAFLEKIRKERERNVRIIPVEDWDEEKEF